MSTDNNQKKIASVSNILRNIPKNISNEIFENIVKTNQFRIERIISSGQKSPSDFWYDQDWNEWVLMIQGRAVLEFDDKEKNIELNQNDYILIPAHKKHRVKWTDPTQETIWLAIHF